MDPTPDQVSNFGATVRRFREAAGYTVKDVALILGDHLGQTVSHQSVSAWERGEYAPKQRAKVEALDLVLGTPGVLVGILFGDELSDRVARIEERLAAVERSQQAILDELRGDRG